jgi:hypothetical protein
MNRALKFLASLALAVFVAACVASCAGGGLPGVSTQPLHAPVVVENEDAAVKAFRLARNSVDEANADLTALNRVIASNATAGIWTKSQAQGYLNRSKDFGKQVDQARAALLVGDLNDATVKAAAIKALIVQLQLELAKAARGG